jgi:hypothetical protein
MSDKGISGETVTPALRRRAAFRMADILTGYRVIYRERHTAGTRNLRTVPKLPHLERRAAASSSRILACKS